MKKGGKAPAPIIIQQPPPPPPPPPPPALEDPAVQKAALDAVQVIQNQRGRSSTILTGGRGVTSDFRLRRPGLQVAPVLSSDQDTLFARFLGQ